MQRSLSGVLANSASRNHKSPPATHWQRQAAVRRGEQYLRVDSGLLEPWHRAAAVVGVSVSEYIEGFLTKIGRPLDAAIWLEEAIRDRLYLTRAEAEAAAERWEMWMVDMQLRGNRNLPVLSAKAVERGHDRWGIEPSMLGPDGWVSDFDYVEDDEDGESWKKEEQ